MRDIYVLAAATAVVVAIAAWTPLAHAKQGWFGEGHAGALALIDHNRPSPRPQIMLQELGASTTPAK